MQAHARVRGGSVVDTSTAVGVGQQKSNDAKSNYCNHCQGVDRAVELGGGQGDRLNGGGELRESLADQGTRTFRPESNAFVLRGSRIQGMTPPREGISLGLAIDGFDEGWCEKPLRWIQSRNAPHRQGPAGRAKPAQPPARRLSIRQGDIWPANQVLASTHSPAPP